MPPRYFSPDWRRSRGRFLCAHCHLGLGQLCRRIGTRDQAQEHLKMDMRFWLEQAEAEMSELG